MQSNRIRIFSELVSLEAWHYAFTARRTSVGLHADVTFSTARLGSEDDCPVRFKMRLKQAVLTVVVPETEALIVDRASVARFDENISGIRKVRSSHKSKGGVAGGVSLKAGATPTASLSLEATKSAEVLDETTITAKFDAIRVNHSLDSDGNNRWSFRPGMEATLTGKPWEASETALMKLRDAEAPGKRKLEASVRLELTCFREDLHIFDIEPKDKSRIPFANLNSEKRKLAAEAFIRTRIQQEGLPVPVMTEDYAIITLARANSTEGRW